MWKQERRQKIVNIVNVRGRLSVNDLAAAVNMSPITVRNDIKEMAEHGLLGRQYGYVYSLKDNEEANRIRYPGDAIEQREQQNSEIKAQVAKAALPYILNSSVIFIDDSTTVFHLLHLIKDFTGLTIVTSSILALSYLSHYPNIHVVGLGGSVDTVHSCFTGKVACEIAARYQYDAAFFGCHAFDASLGALENGYSVVGPKQAAAAKSAKNILLVDSSKYDNSEGIGSLSWGDITVLIANALPKNENLLKAIASHKITVKISS